MGADLTAIALTAICAAAAYFVRPKSASFLALRIVIAWAALATAAFLISSRPFQIFALAGVLAALSPARAADRSVFFIGVIAALPFSFSYQVPFPGINYLISVNYGTVATLVILGPSFFAALAAPASSRLRAVDALVISFVLYTNLMAFRELPFTSVVRELITGLITIYIPYIAISRSLATEQDMKKAIHALILSMTILAICGIFQTARSWNWYIHLADRTTQFSFDNFRNGFFRIGITVIPTLLAYMMAVGFIGAWIYRKANLTPFVVGFAILAIFPLVGYATGARGGWVGAFVVVTAFLAFRMKTPSIWSAYIGCLLIGLAYFFYLVFTDSPMLQDEYGTLGYRAELIRTAFAQVADRPLFGASNIMELPRFQNLRQGEGIIDLVNGYIQIVLYYGLVGLGLYLAAHFMTIGAGLARLKAALPNHHEKFSVPQITALLLAAHIGFLATLFTISAQSHMSIYGVIMLAVSVANVRAAPVRALAPARKPAATRDSREKNDASAVRIPYGARFVRRR